MDSGGWWRRGRPGGTLSIGSRWVGHDFATNNNNNCLFYLLALDRFHLTVRSRPAVNCVLRTGDVASQSCQIRTRLFLTRFYDEAEARKYTHNSRMIEIQSQMSERAVELLGLPDDRPCFLLDVGCGSGLSGDYISEEGHCWVGMDISPAMLDVAMEREVEGDLMLADMGQGIPFRPGTFDGCISISAVQWLCNADKKTHSPPKRLYRFFSTLYTALARGARAVLQLYPENSQQLELITSQAMKAGFTGGMVVDYPNSTKAKKFFLCLFAGITDVLPKGLGTECSEEETTEAKFTNERIRFRNAKGKSVKKSRDWVLEKKERRRRQGKSVRADTKYTGRKRKPHF